MRLNTGGTFLSDQELRNAWLVMFNKKLYEWFVNLSENEDFIQTTALTEKLRKERYDLELIVTFFVYPDNYSEFSKYDKNDVLTRGLKRLAEKDLAHEIDLDGLEEKFKATFRLLNKTLNDCSFRKYYSAKKSFKGGLLESLYETVAIGLSSNINSYTDAETDSLEKKIIELWEDLEFTTNMGSGTNTKRRVPFMIPFGAEYFKK